MKKVLIVGTGSYIGESFAAYTDTHFEIKTISTIDGSWEAFDYTGYDSVLHCAGIAHVPQKRNIRDLYYYVNCDLAVNVAKKAKEAGVRQFVFLSSMAVYGNKVAEITPSTLTAPQDFYGGSKLMAEQQLQALVTPDFKLCIVRPPMVYGYNCKGNFPRLVNWVMRLPVFPDVCNKRSMIYIDNLCACLRLLIDSDADGIHLPQNKEHVNTTELVKLIAAFNGKKIVTTKALRPLAYIGGKLSQQLNKVFGSLYYTNTGCEDSYNVVDFEDSIRLSLQTRM